MEANFKQLSRVKELAFMGKVNASLSHEIKNTLAIINESVGLMGDLLGKEPPADWEAYPRLKSIIASIEEQVQRSGAIIKRLNRFAHSTDKPVAAVDLNELVEEITTLAQRFARLRGVKLEVKLASEPLVIHSDPFRIQQVIFAFIERGLWHCSPNQTQVSIACRGKGNMAQIIVTDEGSPEGDWLRKRISAALAPACILAEEEDPELAILALTMAQLGGSIEAEDVGATGNKVILSFPAKIPEE